MMTVDKKDILRDYSNRVVEIGSAVLSNSSTISSSNTGDGTITSVNGDLRTPTETWTLTCTVAAVDGGTFSVVGSVSGAKADATVGVSYDNGQISFIINDGATDWAVGDTITIDIVRDISELTLKKSLSTIQVECSGDLSSLSFDIEGSIKNDKFFTTDTITLTSSELQKGAIKGLSGIIVDESRLLISDATISTTANIYFYAK